MKKCFRKVNKREVKKPSTSPFLKSHVINHKLKEVLANEYFARFKKYKL